MKNSKAVTIILLTLAIFGLYLAMQYFGQKHSWNERYVESKKDPYTLYLTSKILKDYYPNHQFYSIKKNFPKTLKETNHANGNYMFFGEQYYISEQAADSLLAFIEKGNNAFITTKELPYPLIFRLFGGTDFCGFSDYTRGESFWDTMANVNLIHPNLLIPDGFTTKTMDRFGAASRDWKFIPSKYICNSGIHATGTINNKYVNFGYIPYGKGRVYFHTNPIVFTNYFLMQKTGKTYLDGIMAHLDEGDIYYDIAARNPRMVENQNQRNRNRRSPNFGNEGPLSYILSKPPLATAWYILLLMGVLFLIFRSKRKQRIIPIVEKNENTSLIFIQNISNLYFQQGNNKQLCLQKFNHFQDFIRSKYALNYKNNTPDFAERLAQKSGIDVTRIMKILTIHTNIKNSTFLSDATMTKLHNAINHFYKNCK